jgi:hypothetical protein
MSNAAEDQAWRRQNRIANGLCGRCNEPQASGKALCQHHLDSQWYLKGRRKNDLRPDSEGGGNEGAVSVRHAEGTRRIVRVVSKQSSWAGIESLISAAIEL